jgi:hypothetical protein
VQTDYRWLLEVRRLPARLLAEQVCVLLQVSPVDIWLLTREKFLTPLGGGKDASANCTKYYSSAEIEILMQDRRWLCKATAAIQRYHKKRNEKQRDDSTSQEKKAA